MEIYGIDVPALVDGAVSEQLYDCRIHLTEEERAYNPESGELEGAGELIDVYDGKGIKLDFSTWHIQTGMVQQDESRFILIVDSFTHVSGPQNQAPLDLGPQDAITYGPTGTSWFVSAGESGRDAVKIDPTEAILDVRTRK